MNAATQEVLRICEQLPEAELAAVAEFARSRLGHSAASAADDAAGLATTDEDIAMMRQSMKEIDAGQWTEASVFFGELRAKLLAMKAEQAKAAK